MDIETSSVSITTSRLSEVRRFYEQHWDAKTVFDCGWYIVLLLAGGEVKTELCLMQPRDGATEFAGGVTLNLRVVDVDATYTRLTSAGVEPMIPLEDHPWGDRGFGVLDPCGLVVYCYHEIEPADDFKQYFVKSG